MDAAFGKITEAAPGSHAAHIGHIDERFGALHEGHARIKPAMWAAIADAVASSHVTATRYRRFDGAQRDYLIEPLRLVAHRGNWYALGRKRPGGELRAFALKPGAQSSPESAPRAQDSSQVRRTSSKARTARPCC